MLLHRICRTCNKRFVGGPRSYFCPKCRKAHTAEVKRLYDQRRAAGLTKGSAFDK